MGRFWQKLEVVADRIAARQHGAVTRPQLLAEGFSPSSIDRRVRWGLLKPAFPGVYLVGAAQAPLAREAAAILACAPRAFLTHGTSARLLHVAEAGTGKIEVTVIGRSRRGCRDLTVHSIDHLAPGEVRRHEGLPIASPSLTLLDIATRLTRDELADAIHAARHRGLVTDAELQATLVAHPQRPGAQVLGRLLGSAEMSMSVESRAEARCLRLMIRHHLKPDRSQAQVGPYRVDFLYERERLVVEVDGYRNHGGRKPFDDDRRRTSYLLSRGYAVFPITWTDLTQDPKGTMRRLRAALLARRSAV